jgi:hypothetical protein
MVGFTAHFVSPFDERAKPRKVRETYNASWMNELQNEHEMGGPKQHGRDVEGM